MCLSVKYCPVVRAQKQFLWDIISDDVSDLHTARWASDLAAYVHHTHTQSTALCPVLPRWAGTRNVRDSEWQWHQLGHICKSAPRSRQIATPAPHHSVFTARCSASAVLAMGLCLCLSVRLSVTSRSSTITAKRRITNNTARYPKNSSFLMPKISTKFDRGYPIRARRMQVGGSKSATFD